MEKTLIKFEKTDSSIPFIRVKHNNVSFNLIIDTGCTISCIDKNILELLVHENTDGKSDVLYANGTSSEEVEIVNIPITIGDNTYNESFNAIDFSNMAKQVADTYGITIRGLLGSEFMYKHQLILDFEKHLIRYTGNQTEIEFK